MPRNGRIEAHMVRAVAQMEAGQEAEAMARQVSAMETHGGPGLKLWHKRMAALNLGVRN